MLRYVAHNMTTSGFGNIASSDFVNLPTAIKGPAMDDTATTHLNDERKIIEHGPSCGKHYDQDIPAHIMVASGSKYVFDRIAVEGNDGLVALSQLDPNEFVIAPGLIYRKAV